MNDIEEKKDAAPKKKDRGALILTIIIAGFLALVIVAQMFGGGR